MRLNRSQMKAVLYRLWDKAGQPNESMIFLTKVRDGKAAISDYVSYQYYSDNEDSDQFPSSYYFYIDCGEIHDRMRELLYDPPPQRQRFPAYPHLSREQLEALTTLPSQTCVYNEDEDVGPPF